MEGILYIWFVSDISSKSYRYRFAVKIVGVGSIVLLCSKGKKQGTSLAAIFLKDPRKRQKCWNSLLCNEIHIEL